MDILKSLLIFVFASLGTKLYKDKVMGLTDQAKQAAAQGVPSVIFANWREVLNLARLSEPTRSGYALAITGYLDYCRRNGLSVTKESARAFMADVERRQLARNPPLWKTGINWFFTQGRRASAWVPGGEPTPGAADTGTTPWERRLIERLRLNHYSWRTEQTYREWAWRLTHFIQPRDLESATGEDIKAFLSELAVKGRVALATQKQALNALVFLFEKG